MKHCVFDYAEDIVAGTSSIWSLRREGTRELTVQIDEERVILQARGRQNRHPTEFEGRLLDRWADEAGLTITADFND